jgi:hypothetical protein
LFTAAHEAAHAVQQRSGLGLPQGIGTPGDRHEHHADEVARQVVAGQSSEALLDRYTSLGGVPRAGLQLIPQSTHYGRFLDTTYKKLPNDKGVEIMLEFEPNDQVDAKKFGLVQSIRSSAEGTALITDPSQQSRIVGSGGGEGYRIDRITPQNNPIYGSASLKPGENLEKTADTNAPKGEKASTINATYELGSHYTDNGKPIRKNAWIYDAPQREPSKNSANVFETAALAIDGAQKGTYYGSVQWGWERDGAGVLSRVTFASVSQGTPSQNFLAPAAAFNAATTRGTLVARLGPTQVYKMKGSSFDPDFTIAKGTIVTTSGSVGAGKIEYRVVSIADDSRSGFIKAMDLQDKGDGSATVDLPVPEVYFIDAAVGVTLNDKVPPYAAGAALPKGTRVKPTGVTRSGGGDKVLKWVVVVDGANTGASGYVPADVLKKERP